ncbi:hypothetical protein FAI41_04185 [Acetobacteraceae bacterium]|nr:hypothetical protein FAI41_04185 [Acetobacteraceae bacterium]
MLNFKNAIWSFFKKAYAKPPAIPAGLKKFFVVFSFLKYLLFCLIVFHGLLKIITVSLLLTVLFIFGYVRSEKGWRWRFIR